MASTKARLASMLVALAIFVPLGHQRPAWAISPFEVYQGQSPQNTDAPHVFFNYSLILDPGESIQSGDILVFGFDNVTGAGDAMNTVTDYLAYTDIGISGNTVRDTCAPQNCAMDYFPHSDGAFRAPFNTALDQIRTDGSFPGAINYKFIFKFMFTSLPYPQSGELDFFIVDWGSINRYQFNAYFDPTVTLFDQNMNVKYRGGTGSGDPGAPAAMSLASKRLPGAGKHAGGSMRSNTNERPRRSTMWSIGSKDAVTPRPTTLRLKNRANGR